MSDSRAPAAAALSLAAIFGLSGCVSDPRTNSVIGAATGAAIGAALGNNTGSYPSYGYPAYAPTRVCRQYPITRPDRYGYPQTHYVTRCE